MQSKSKRVKKDDVNEKNATIQSSTTSTAAAITTALNPDVLAILHYREKVGLKDNELDLLNQQVGDEGIAELCQWISKMQGKITSLQLSGCGLSTKGAAALFSFLKEHHCGVSQLNVSRNSFDLKFIDDLIDLLKINKTIEGIELYNSNITDESIDKLSKGLVGNTSLKTLGIEGNKKVTDKSIPSLVKLIENSHIIKIVIQDTRITQKGSIAEALTANVLKYSADTLYIYDMKLQGGDAIGKICDVMKKFGVENLKSIELGQNDIGSSNATILLDTLTGLNANIELLNLYYNKLDDKCMKALGEFVKNSKTIKSVGLQQNKIGDKGIKTLSEYLHGNISLKELQLDSNEKITNKSVQSIVNMIESSHIGNISLRFSGIQNKESKISMLSAMNALKYEGDTINLNENDNTDDDVKMVCDAMDNHGCQCLKFVELGGDKITTNGVILFLNSLNKHKPALTSFNISNIKLDDECMKLLSEYLHNNRSLTSLYLQSTQISAKGIKLLCDSLIGNTTLQHIYLNPGNDITDASADDLINLVKRSAINHIGISFDNVSDNNSQRISNSLSVPVEKREILG